MRGRVYASLPLTGPSGAAGRDVLRGAELALERAARPRCQLVVLDSAGADREARAGANARTAASDPGPSPTSATSTPRRCNAPPRSSAEAGLLAVAPVATFTGLRGPTLVRLTPDDRAGAGRSRRGWPATGARELLVVHDHDDGYGLPVGADVRRGGARAGHRGARTTGLG